MNKRRAQQDRAGLEIEFPGRRRIRSGAGASCSATRQNHRTEPTEVDGMGTAGRRSTPRRRAAVTAGHKHHSHTRHRSAAPGRRPLPAPRRLRLPQHRASLPPQCALRKAPAAHTRSIRQHHNLSGATIQAFPSPRRGVPGGHQLCGEKRESGEDCVCGSCEAVLTAAGQRDGAHTPQHCCVCQLSRFCAQWIEAVFWV